MGFLLVVCKVLFIYYSFFFSLVVLMLKIDVKYVFFLYFNFDFIDF